MRPPPQTPKWWSDRRSVLEGLQALYDAGVLQVPTVLPTSQILDQLGWAGQEYMLYRVLDSMVEQGWLDGHRIQDIAAPEATSGWFLGGLLVRSEDIDWEAAAQSPGGPVSIHVQGPVGQVTTGGQVTNIASTVGGSVDWSNDLKEVLDRLRHELEEAQELSDDRRAEAIAAIEDVEEARTTRPERLGGRLRGLVSVLNTLAPYAAMAPQWMQALEPFVHAQ